MSDDTGWDTDWLRLERAWAPKIQNGGCYRPKTAIKSVQSTIILLLLSIFVFKMRFCLGCCAVNQSHFRF